MADAVCQGYTIHDLDIVIISLKFWQSRKKYGNTGDIGLMLRSI
jgi:hypothetical protein